MSAYQHLTRAQLRQLRIDLEHELAWLDRATSIGSEEQFAASRPSDEDDASGHGGLAVALHDHTRTRHLEVTHALERIENGEYGSCARCDSAIPYERLFVMPEAAHCVSCGGLS